MPQAPPIRVVCADDDPQILAAMHTLLSMNTDIVFLGCVTSAAGLVQRIADVGPDVVVLDLAMPGFEAHTAIAELALVAPRTRVLVLTGSLPRGGEDGLLSAGVWGIAMKDWDPRRIVQAIRDVHAGKVVLEIGKAAGGERGGAVAP